jgi:hypothetical protein
MTPATIKTTAFRAGRGSILVPWLMNVGAYLVATVAKLPTKYSDRAVAYGEASGRIGSDPGAAYHNDIALNFFARLVMEKRFDFVIELGAYSLDRSLRLKKLFPELKVFALDVTKDFAGGKEIEGVVLLPNTLDNIRAIAQSNSGRGLICSHGTLCYYATDALAELINLAHGLRLCFAIAEPNTIGENSLQWSLRRTYKSWFHPYLFLLRRQGYTLPDGNGHQIRDCVSRAGEERTYLFADCGS